MYHDFLGLWLERYSEEFRHLYFGDAEICEWQSRSKTWILLYWQIKDAPRFLFSLSLFGLYFVNAEERTKSIGCLAVWVFIMQMWSPFRNFICCAWT